MQKTKRRKEQDLKLVLLSRRVGAKIRPIVHSRAFRWGLNIALAGAVVFFLAYGLYANWESLRQHEWTIHYGYLALACAVYGLCFLTVLLAWNGIMSSIEAMRDWRVNARIFCYSSLPKRIPGVVWYIASRVHLYKKEEVARSITLVGIALETTLLFVTALMVYLSSLFFPIAVRSAARLPPTVALLLLLPALSLLVPAVLNRVVERLLSVVHYPGRLSLKPGNLLGLTGLYLLAWVLGGVDLYLLARAVYPVPPDLLPAVIGAWAASSAISYLASYIVQGMGVSEVALSVLLSSYLPLSVAIVIAILFRILLMVGEVAWALLLAWGLAGFRGLPLHALRDQPPSTPAQDMDEE